MLIYIRVSPLILAQILKTCECLRPEFGQTANIWRHFLSIESFKLQILKKELIAWIFTMMVSQRTSIGFCFLRQSLRL